MGLDQRLTPEEQAVIEAAEAARPQVLFAVTMSDVHGDRLWESSGLGRLLSACEALRAIQTPKLRYEPQGMTCYDRLTGDKLTIDEMIARLNAADAVDQQ
jgi:hypothetical protein